MITIESKLTFKSYRLGQLAIGEAFCTTEELSREGRPAVLYLKTQNSSKGGRPSALILNRDGTFSPVSIKMNTSVCPLKVAGNIDLSINADFEAVEVAAPDPEEEEDAPDTTPENAQEMPQKERELRGGLVLPGVLGFSN